MGWDDGHNHNRKRVEGLLLLLLLRNEMCWMDGWMDGNNGMDFTQAALLSCLMPFSQYLVRPRRSCSSSLSYRSVTQDSHSTCLILDVDAGEKMRGDGGDEERRREVDDISESASQI